MNKQPDILIFSDKTQLAREAAERICQAATASIAATGRFVMVLAGGSTPEGTYNELSKEPYRSRIDWQCVFLFIGDERYVPLDHPDSNYLMARNALINRVGVPEEQVYPMPTHFDDPQRAAETYEQQLRSVLEQGSGRFDLVLLGMGPDGHTASLFPHHPGLNAPESMLVSAVYNSPKPPPLRLTLTASALNNADRVFFLVAGADKADALHAILRENADPMSYPSRLIQPAGDGKLTWMLDQAAAARL